MSAEVAWGLYVLTNAAALGIGFWAIVRADARARRDRTSAAYNRYLLTVAAVVVVLFVTSAVGMSALTAGR